jgi:hypothetical protein
MHHECSRNETYRSIPCWIILYTRNWKHWKHEKGESTQKFHETQPNHNCLFHQAMYYNSDIAGFSLRRWYKLNRMIMDSNQEKNCLKGLGYAQFKKQLIPSGNQLDSFLANDSARESYPTSYIRTIQSHGPGGTLPHKLGHHQCKLFLPFLQVQISSGTSGPFSWPTYPQQ